ncbi:MAG: SagB/ThcOx family dehydrogenase [Proteobacteria bacterium]|nr:SagB/ThcOx family dehydrogenase [Pseudomonadota bacterium]
MNSIEQYRYFLKDTIRKTINFSNTDQSQGIPAPPVEKPFDPGSIRIPLHAPDQLSEKIKKKDLISAMSSRKSRRNYSSEELSVEELSFLLWGTQGIRESGGSNPAFRTVPSAGARHSFETYLFIMRIGGVEKGLYRYLPVENELLFLSKMEFMEEQLVHACFGQNYVAGGAATFVWTTIPYRMEWRYSLAAHRVILLDAGHVCQNLYLACEAINAGTCAIGAYDQDELDSLLNVDGTDEFAIYLAPVGKIK